VDDTRNTQDEGDDGDHKNVSVDDDLSDVALLPDGDVKDDGQNAERDSHDGANGALLPDGDVKDGGPDATTICSYLDKQLHNHDHVQEGQHDNGKETTGNEPDEDEALIDANEDKGPTDADETPVMDHDSIANTGVGKGEADPTGTTGVYEGSHSISGNVTSSGATCCRMWYNGVTHYETNRYNGVTDYETNHNSTSHSSVTNSAVRGMTHSTDDGQQGDLLWDGSVMESPDGKVELRDQFTTGPDNSKVHDENDLSNGALPHDGTGVNKTQPCEVSNQVGATEFLVQYFPLEEILADAFTESPRRSILWSFYITVLNIQGMSCRASRSRPQECVEEHLSTRTDVGSRSQPTQRRVRMNDRRGMKLHVGSRNKGEKVAFTKLPLSSETLIDC
jgi:hypothetical protein